MKGPSSPRGEEGEREAGAAEGRGCGEEGTWRWWTGPAGDAEARGLLLPDDVVRDLEGQCVTLVWKWRQGEWERWVVVMRSAALRSVGIEEDGLYAWGRYARGAVVGTYSGKEVASFVEGRMARARAAASVGTVGRYVLEREGPGERRTWVDGEGAGPPYLQCANDARGVYRTSGVQCQNTAAVEPGTLIMTVRADIGGEERWGRADGWAGVRDQELLWSYGQQYWREWGSEAMKQAAEEAAGRRKERDGERRSARTAEEAERKEREAAGRRLDGEKRAGRAGARASGGAPRRWEAMWWRKGERPQEGEVRLRAAAAYERVRFVTKQGSVRRLIWIEEMMAEGRGHVMMKSILRRATPEEKVQLHVGRDNVRAVKVYRGMGMVEVTEEAEMWAVPEDAGEVMCMGASAGSIRARCEERAREGRVEARSEREARHGNRGEV